MSLEAFAALAQVVAVIVAAIAVVISLQGLRKQMWLITFSEYTRRYAELRRELPLVGGASDGAFELAQLKGAEHARMLMVLACYLNLCSEEMYLHGKGTIDAETWRMWDAEITSTLSLPWFVDAWAQLRDHYDSYPEFLQYVEQRLHTRA